MISRAKYGIEYIKQNSDYVMGDKKIEQISRIFDINFDMKDVAISDDIIKWLKNEYLTNKKDINDYIFSEPVNNDGKLFINFDQKSKEIKYCFTDSYLNILSADEYMQWNISVRWDKEDYSDNPEWKKIATTCKKNIKSINKTAKLMSEKELKHFITDDYTKQINDIFVDNDIKI